MTTTDKSHPALLDTGPFLPSASYEAHGCQAHKRQILVQLPMGACMCSPLFSAAGVRDMHLESTWLRLGYPG